MKKEKQGRKPFEFGKSEEEQVARIVTAWEKILIEQPEDAMASDILVCALGNFIARFIGNLSHVAHQQGEEYFYLASIDDWTKNTLRQAGIDIDQQEADFNARIAARMKKHGAAIKLGEA